MVETQQRRASERFDIISWIRSNQQAISAQNAKYGYSKGGTGPYPDISLMYMQDSGTVTRDSATLGKDSRASGRIQFLLDDLFTRGTRTQSLNIDLGVEGYMSQTTTFSVDPTSSQVNHSYTETGGALLLRPFGRSSQDTGLMVKGGYLNFVETGLWANSQNQVSMFAPYLGAEAKLYLLPFLGGRAEYQAALETSVDALQGKWKMQRFTYGAFLEIYLLEVDAYLMSTELDFTPVATGTMIKESYSGAGLSGTLHF